MSRERNDKEEHTDEDAGHDVKNYLDAVIQTSHDGILVVDSEGRFEFGNEAFFRIFGWPREELLGHHFIKVVPPDLHEFILERWEEVQAGKGAPYEIDIVRKDGTRRSLLVSHRHMTIAGQRKYCVITRDVTERKRTQDALFIQSEIVAHMSEGVNMLCVSDLTIIYANPKLEDMLGYRPGELLGKHISIINAPTEKSPEETADEVKEIVRKHGAWNGEVKNIRKDGTSFWCHASVSTFEHPEQGTVFIAVQTDITERKQAEEELARYRIHLEEMVQMRTRELTDAEANLRRVHRRLLNVSEAERRRLAAELHDSVGQKLVAMEIAIQQILMACEDTTGHEAEVQALQNVGQQCTETIQEIRAICYGLYPPMLELTGLAASLRQLGRSCEPAVSFHLQCDDSLAEARFDPEQEIALFRMAQEAVSNALKHSEATSISIILEKQADILTMAIRDDGVGFDTTSQLGQGLGLRSMTERARAVGGTIAITSHPGRTSVEVTLPVKPPETPKA